MSRNEKFDEVKHLHVIEPKKCIFALQKVFIIKTVTPKSNYGCIKLVQVCINYRCKMFLLVFIILDQKFTK